MNSDTTHPSSAVTMIERWGSKAMLPGGIVQKPLMGPWHQLEGSLMTGMEGLPPTVRLQRTAANEDGFCGIFCKPD